MSRDEQDLRRRELLLDRALEGLDADAEAELRSLGGADDDSFDLAAAAVVLAALPVEPMPAMVAEGVLRALPAKEVRDVPRRRPFARTVVLALGGLAAAMLLLAVGAWWGRSTRPQGGDVAPPVLAGNANPAVVAPPTAPVSPPAPPVTAPAEVPALPPATAPALTPAQARARLLAEARDARTLAWTATADRAAQGSSGDVVWSRSKQQGFMRFVGLAPNDRRRAQYQLWIFDKRRDQRYPVDGGVFDVTSRGETIVPITARLRVSRATLFAVTVERPGGVVVSRRKRIVVTAAPAAG